MKCTYQYLVSACLCGVKCRYNGEGYLVNRLKDLVDNGVALMVCPELLGGLGVPRLPCEIVKERVLNNCHEDLTIFFQKGAKMVLKLAQNHHIKTAILKEKSPSCGSSLIYDGGFCGKLIPGEGLTARLLRQNGIVVLNEETFMD